MKNANKKRQSKWWKGFSFSRPHSKKAAQKKPDDIYRAPLATASGPVGIIGLALRYLVIYIGIFALTAFLCAAAGLSTQVHWQACYVSPGFIALAALPVAVAVFLASLNRLTAVLVPLGFAGATLGICAIAHGNPFYFLYRSVIRIYNFALYSMVERRYYSMGNYMIADGLDYSQAGYMSSDPYRFWGVFLLTALIGLILGLCMARRTKLIPLCAVFAIVLIPIFTYNISQGTVGIGFIIAFAIGCIVLWIYDDRYAGPLEKRRARKKRRKERKAEKRKASEKKREEKEALRQQANKLFQASLSSDMGRHRAYLAKRAVFKAKKKSVKTAKLRTKQNAKAAKKAKKAARKEANLARKEEKKAAIALKKSGDTAELTRLHQQHEDQIAKKKDAKAAKRAAKKEARKKEALHRRAIAAGSGYAAFGAVLVALLALWIPMTAVKSSFTIIAPINNRVQIARAYVTAYLSGDDIDLNDLASYGISELTPRSLSFDPLEYKEKRILRIETTGTNNVYLRSWIGTKFDLETDTWKSADYDQVLAFRQTFGVDFTPDEITYHFNKYVYPSSVEITEKNFYQNLSKFGFTVQQVHIRRLSGSSLILPIPSHMNTELGLLAFGSLDDAPKKYSKYFDGIYSSRFYNSGSEYSTVSFITTMNRADVGDAIAGAQAYYAYAKDLVASYPDPDQYSEEQLAEITGGFEQILAAENIDYIGTSFAQRYYFTMSKEEREEFQKAVATETEYAQYAADNYTAGFGSTAVAGLAEEIRNAAQAESDAALSDYELTMAVINYLKENYTYSKTPDSEAYLGEGSVLEAFLFEVKEGYCSHFATAACALLRDLGVPTRFVEGYVATEFDRVSGNSGAGYRTFVKDDNAHAWIEVYLDGMGWTQFEATPGDYQNAMYDPNGATVQPEAPTPEDNPASPETPEQPSLTPPTHSAVLPEEDNSEFEAQLRLFVTVIVCTAAAALILWIIWLIIRRIQKKAMNMIEKRYRVIDLVRTQELYEDPNIDRHHVLHQINDWILDIFRILGAPPQPGELPADFGARIAAEYGNLSSEDITLVMEYMQKEEFGHGLTYEEARICGEYLSDLIASVYAGLSLPQKIRVRYIKRMI